MPSSAAETGRPRSYEAWILIDLRVFIVQLLHVER
jgi:hypothetical protein